MALSIKFIFYVLYSHWFIWNYITLGTQLCVASSGQLYCIKKNTILLDIHNLYLFEISVLIFYLKVTIVICFFKHFFYVCIQIFLLRMISHVQHCIFSGSLCHLVGILKSLFFDFINSFITRLKKLPKKWYKCNFVKINYGYFSVISLKIEVLLIIYRIVLKLSTKM